MGNCPECGGSLVARATPGMSACVSCGKPVFGEPEDLPVEARDPSTIKPEDVSELAVGQFQVPDYTEVMVGWRSWKVAEELPASGPPLLYNVSHNPPTPWVPYEAMEATCSVKKHQGQENRDEIPLRSCSCGLYCAKTKAHLMGMPYHHYEGKRDGNVCVIGTVNLWGTMVEATQGWRHQYGYPRELLVPFETPHLAAPLCEAYGVPVKLSNILKDQYEKGAK